MTSLYLNDLPKDSVCKHSDLQRYQTLVLQHMNLGTDTIQPIAGEEQYL